MPTTECPQCRMPTANAMGKTYCPQCGWNRGEADKQTRLFLRVLPVLVILFDAPLIVWIFIGHAEVPVLGMLGLVAIVPAILVVLVVKEKIRIPGLGPLSASMDTGANAQERKQSSATADGTVAGPYDEMSQLLAELPRQRAVRLSSRGKMVAASVCIAFLLCIAGYAAADMSIRRAPGVQINQAPQFPAYALTIAFLAMFFLIARNISGTQKGLLAEGEIGMARVINRRVARGVPYIQYDFTTSRGEHFSRMVADGSKRLAVGMSVPIFYNAQQPKKQVALCASFYELVLPGGK